MKWALKSGRVKKYGSQATERDGYTFQSKLEGAVYDILKLRKMAGEILEIQCQDQILLSDAQIRYIADFKCKLPNDTFLWVEAKGFQAARWPDLKKLYRAYGPGPLEIWMGHHSRPTLSETIIPRVKL